VKFVLSAVAAAVCTHAAAYAAPTVTAFDGDGVRGDFFFINSEQAVAEARYGNNAGNGNWEMGVGIDTQQSSLSNMIQRTWTNGVSQDFTLTYLAGTGQLVLAIDPWPNSVSYNVGPLSVNDLAIRIGFGDGSGTNTGNRVELTNLAFTNDYLVTPPAAIAPDSLTSTLDESGARYLLLENGFSTGDSFQLSGSLLFEWSAANSALAGSRPSFQVKVVEAVPEPGSVALLAVAGLALAARRR